jgi:AraC-like DNA-binding protein
MRTVSPLALSSLDFFVRDTELFPESWTHRHSFSAYADTPRPVSALFLVATDIRVTFYPRRGEPVTATRGDLFFIPEGTRYSVKVAGGSENRIDTYTLNFRLLDPSGESLLFSERISPVARDERRHIEAQLGALGNALHRIDRHGELREGGFAVRAELFRLFDLLASPERETDSEYYPIRAGVEALKNEWNLNRRIAEYAALSGVSETYFYRCFRRFSGKSPIEYRNMLRLSHAEAMLRRTEMRVSEIAQTVGFDDPFYFCRLFSKTFGASPRKYRSLAGEKGDG